MFTFWAVHDYFLKKIKVLFHLLPIPKKYLLASAEKQTLLNIYCAEIVHAPRAAKRASIPIQRVHLGTEKHGWSGNLDLVDSCAKSKF